MKLSYLITSILSVSVVALATAVFNFHNTLEQQKTNYIVLEEANIQLADKYDALKIELSHYQQILDGYETELAFLKEQSATSFTSPTNSKNLDIAENIELQPEEPTPNEVTENSDTQDLLAFARRIQSGENVASIEDDIRKNFNEEALDENWAYTFESNIHELVAQDEQNNFNIQELVCKTTVCEIKLTANENNSFMLGTLFSKKLGEQKWREKGGSVIFNHEIKDGAMSILIGRNKDSFIKKSI